MGVTQRFALRLKSVYQNCVLGRCVHVALNHIATSPILLFFWNMAYKNGNLHLHDQKFMGGVVTQL